MSRPTSDKVLYPELSYTIIACAYEVHNSLGPGFGEDIYENALVRELEIRGIPREQQKPIQVVYKERVVGHYRLDLVIEGKIIVELKAVSTLTDLFKEQLLSYLKATGLHLGILLNFGARRVEYHRVAYGEEEKREWRESAHSANEGI